MTECIADYSILSENDANRYSFFCGLSGARICTTGPISAQTQQEELKLAWSSEGRRHFNHCRMCGRWVCDSMYNPDALGCVKCFPVISLQRYCMTCGQRVHAFQTYCGSCGSSMQYGGKNRRKDQRETRHIRNLRHHGFGTDAMQNLKICPICKSITGASRETCPACNEKLSDGTLYQYYRSLSRRCINCETIVPQDAAYCPQCGKKLRNN